MRANILRRWFKVRNPVWHLVAQPRALSRAMRIAAGEFDVAGGTATSPTATAVMFVHPERKRLAAVMSGATSAVSDWAFLRFDSRVTG